MKTTESDLLALRRLNKRFIHNFVTNDVPSRERLTPVTAENYPGGDSIVVKYLRGVLQAEG